MKRGGENGEREGMRWREKEVWERRGRGRKGVSKESERGREKGRMEVGGI